DQRRAAEWLENHIGPPDTVRHYWTLSYAIRKRILKEGCTVHDYYSTFPVLKSAQGAELLVNDFDVLYPDLSQNFLHRWQVARDIVITALNSCTGIKGEDLGFKTALPSLAQHNKDALLFYLLPYLIKPPRRGAEGEKSLTVKEKQAAFILHVETAADIEGALNTQRKVCGDSNTTLQPLPIVVGPLVKLDAFYVYINDSLETPTIYQSPDLLHMIDLTFKVFFSLNCSYPTRAVSLWTFIQKAFYDIHLETDKCNRDTEALIGQISHECTGGDENVNPNGR
ncbi:uncharacterized protein LOC107047642, partial [Diachasma alloeum]|uniref:uncharacterized protein LOC107047642 n=1 Tax=Diachasma alloeum TaxID=454923 RepID=UPI0007382E9E